MQYRKIKTWIKQTWIHSLNEFYIIRFLDRILCNNLLFLSISLFKCSLLLYLAMIWNYFERTEIMNKTKKNIWKRKTIIIYLPILKKIIIMQWYGKNKVNQSWYFKQFVKKNLFLSWNIPKYVQLFEIAIHMNENIINENKTAH